MTTDRKIVIGVGIAVVVAMFFLGRCNGIRSVTKRTGSDTVIRKDSFIYVDNPVPFEVIRRDTTYIAGKKQTFTIHDTLETFEVRIDPVDTSAILARFQDTAIYDNTIKFNRGTVRLREKVSENRIKARQMDVTVNDSVITNTIIKTLPRKFVGYWTLSAGGNLSTPYIQSGGIGLGLKFPGDMVIQAEGKVVNGNKPMLEGRVMFPIRKRKK